MGLPSWVPTQQTRRKCPPRHHYHQTSLPQLESRWKCEYQYLIVYPRENEKKQKKRENEELTKEVLLLWGFCGLAAENILLFNWRFLSFLRGLLLPT